MDLQKYLKNAARLFKEEPLVFIAGGFLVQLLTILSFGIMIGPLTGGYLLMAILFLRDGKRPRFGDLFAGFTRLRILFPYLFLVLLLIVGIMLFILPGIVFATWWIYALPLMADRNLSFGQAMRQSMIRVNEAGFFKHLVFLFLIVLIPNILLSSISHLVPVLNILKILLPPFQVGCLAALYLDMFGAEGDAGEMPTGLEMPAGAASPVSADAAEEGSAVPQSDQAHAAGTSEPPPETPEPEEPGRSPES